MSPLRPGWSSQPKQSPALFPEQPAATATRTGVRDGTKLVGRATTVAVVPGGVRGHHRRDPRRRQCGPQTRSHRPVNRPGATTSDPGHVPHLCSPRMHGSCRQNRTAPHLPRPTLDRHHHPQPVTHLPIPRRHHHDRRPTKPPMDRPPTSDPTQHTFRTDPRNPDRRGPADPGRARVRPCGGATLRRCGPAAARRVSRRAR